MCVCYQFTLQRPEGWRDRGTSGLFSPLTAEEVGTRLSEDQWATSTPDRQDGDPVGFDGGRVRAWLGVQSPGPPDTRTSCCKAVQTDGEMMKVGAELESPSFTLQRSLLQQ